MPESSQTILVVEDEQAIASFVAAYLRKDGFTVRMTASGREALAIIGVDAPSLVVLDLMLPDLDGIEVCRRIRESSTLPVLMLTARDDDLDKIAGLEVGADDYLTKPFSPRELLARVRALVRRAQLHATVADTIAKVRGYRFGAWELNVGLRRLKGADGTAVELTNGEFSLLTAFLSAPQRILTRDQLLELTRLHNAEVYDRSIDVQILRLRRKIEPDPAHPRYIRTERGAGYCFDSSVAMLR